MADLLSILYRGPLRSCNYACGYCPFAKQEAEPSVLAADRRIHRVPSPVGGRVTRVNEEVVIDLDELDRGPDDGGWLLRLRTAPER